MRDSRTNRRRLPPKKKSAMRIAAMAREKIASGLLKPRSDGAFAVMALFCPRTDARYFQLAQAGNIYRHSCQESRDCSGGHAVAPRKWGLAERGRGSIQRRLDAQVR